MRHRSCAVLSSVVLLAVAAPLARAQFDPAYPCRSLDIAPPGGLGYVDRFAVADADRDGRADVLALHSPASKVLELCVSRGLPGGGLAAPQIWPLPYFSVNDLTIADVNADGWPDVVMCTYNQRVLIAYGTGGGGYANSASYFVGSGPLYALCVEDLNHDGQLDLVTGRGFPTDEPGTVNVNLADGAGGFLATQSWPTDIAVADLATGDLDGDGWLDAVVVNSAPAALQVILGDGAGGFRAPLAPKYGDDGAQQVLLGDLDGDGRLDAVTIAGGHYATYASVVRPYLNDGAGGLLDGPGMTVGKHAFSGLLRDVDLDGDLDVLAVLAGTSAVSELLNDGHGNLGIGPNLCIGVPGEYAALIDVTGDGHDDLLVRPEDSTAVVFPAAADGMLPAGATWYAGVNTPHHLAVGDLDRDGWPDVYFASSAPQSSGVLRGSPAGFVLPPLEMPGLADSPFVAELGDMTGDGLLDAVVVSVFTSGHVRVEPGLGNGSFGPPMIASFSTAGATVVTEHLVDLDADGWLDIAVGSTGPVSRIDMYLNQGVAQPGAPGPVHFVSTASKAVDYDFGDLDGDGVQDAVMVRTPSAAGLPSTLAVCAGDGHGSLLPLVSADFPPTPGDVLKVRLGDLDLDGCLDAVASFDEGALAIATGDGKGSLVPGAVLTGQLAGNRLALSDVDGDGWLDVVSGDTTTGRDIVVCRGDGAGGLLPSDGHANAAVLGYFAVTDMNRDGHPDIVVSEGFGSSDHRIHVIDNVRHAFTWTDLQSGKPGSFGPPTLTGTGELLLGTPGELRLFHAAPSALAALVVGIGEQPTPWKGGILMPGPPKLLSFFVTDAQGRVPLPWAAWPDDTPGASVTLQFVIADPGPHGASFSNALRATEPD